MTTFRKSGSGDTPTRTPDNLRSKDTVEVVVGLGMGPIKGPAYGLKGIYVGDTPIQNQNDSYNFKNFEYWFRPGAANDEAVKFRLGGQTNSTTVNVNLYSGTPVVRQTPHGNIDAIKFRIVINSLLWQQDDGDVYQNTAKFKLEYKAASSATWLPCFPPTAELSIKGKTTSTYVKEYRILVPRINEPYDLRVTKTSPESDEEKIVEITWESFQTVITGDKKFNGEAVAHYLGEASDQFSSLPQFWGVYDLMLCRMPDNYDPYTKTWDGTWDGITWKNDWTDNPALVFNEILANEEWGAAAYYPDVTLNKWDLVAAIEWCDGLVPNGQGGYQPRYTFNGLLTEARSGPEMLRFVAGIFGGIPYDGLDGEIRLKLDVDSDAVALFTPENVIEENSITFDYSYTDLTTRYNAISGTFMNPNLDWSEDRLYLENEDAIAANGRIPLDLIAEACTNRHEATRRTMLRLITSQTEKTIVTFKTNRLGLTTELFDIFLVADPDMDWGITGRVKSLSVDREIMYLRDQIYLEAGVDYEIVFQVPGGPTTALAIPNTNVGALTQIDFGAALPAGVEELTTFAIQAPNEPSTPKPFRLVDIAEVEDRTDVVQITGLEVNRNKWAAADAAEYQAAPLYSRPLSAAAMQPPTDLTVDQEAQYAPNGLFIRARLNWQPTTTPGVKHYQVWMSRADDAPILQGTTEDSTFIIPDLPPGPYTFQVYPVSILNNLRSAVPAEVDLYLGDTSGVGTSILTNLEILNQGVDTVFSGRDVVMSWVVDPPAGYFPLGNPTFDGSGFVDPTIAEFKVEILDADTDAVLFTDWTVNTYYRWTYLNNLTVASGPRRSFKARITGLTSYGLYTNSVTLSVSNAAPAAPTGAAATFDVDSLRVTWDAPTDPDYAGTVVYASQTNGFTPGSGNLVFRGAANQARIPVAATGTWYYRVGHYDAFSDMPTNLTSQLSLSVTRLFSADLDAAISDNVLSASEKPLIVPTIERLRGGETDLTARANALGITTKRTTYTSALSALNTTLAGYTSPVAWNTYGGNTTIVGSTLASQLKAAFDAELALQTEIDALNANSLVPVGGNQVVNSTFNPDTSGWGYGGDVDTGLTVVTSRNTGSSSGMNNTVGVTVTGTPASGKQFDTPHSAGPGTLNTGGSTTLAQLQRTALKCKAGDRIYWSAMLAYSGVSSAWAHVVFYNAAGSGIASYAGNSVSGTASGSGGDPANYRQSSGFITAPANAAFMTIRGRFVASGAANPVGYMMQPYYSVVPATQTALPDYQAGPPTYGINVQNLAGTEDINNALVPFGVNQAINSNFSPDLACWTTSPFTNTGLTLTVARNPSGKFGANNVIGVTPVGTPAINTVWDAPAGAGPSATAAEIQRFGMRVVPGERIFISAMFAQASTGVLNAYAKVYFYNSAGTYVSEDAGSVQTSLPTGASGDPANYKRSTAFVTVPAGVAFAVVGGRFTAAGSVASPQGLFMQPMITKVPATQTALPDYQAGPTSWGTNVTNLAGTEDLNNALVALGQNSVFNSRFNPDISGFSQGWDGTVALPVTRGLNAVGKFGARHVGWVAVAGTPANDTIVEWHSNVGNAVGFADMRRFTSKVTAGDRIYISALFGFTNFKNCYLNVTFADSTGTYITETNTTSLTSPGNGDSGTAMTRVGGFFTVPAGAHYANLRFRFTANGSGLNPVGYVAEPFLAIVAANQTVAPVFNHGPDSRGVIVDNMAGTEQLNNARVIGSDANRIRFSEGERPSVLGKEVVSAPASGVTGISYSKVTNSGRSGLRISFTTDGAKAPAFRIGWLDAYATRATPGERIFFGLIVVSSAAVNSAIAGLAEMNSSYGAIQTNAASTLTGAFAGQRWGAFLTLNASTAWLSLYIRVDVNAAGSHTVDIFDPMIVAAALDQTTVPAYRVGLNSDDGANVTQQWPSGGLIADARYYQDSATGRLVTAGVERRQVQDGDSGSFSTAYPFAPKMETVSGGLVYSNTGLTGKQIRQDVYVTTPTTWSVSAKLVEAVGTVTTQTQSTWTTVTLYERYECDKPTSANAWNNEYKVRLNVEVGRTYAGEYEPGLGYLMEGWTEITIASNDGGGWVDRTTVQVYSTSWNATPAADVVTVFNVDIIAVVAALTQHGGREIAAYVSDRSTASGKINGMVNLTYGTATAPASVAATDVNNKILARSYLGAET